MPTDRFPDEWADQRWRLSNLYSIINEQGKAVPFRPNPVQVELLDNLWYFNAILKSRQHGVTSLVDLILLDTAVWNKDVTCGIIAHGLREATTIFRNKVLYPYKNLPAQITQVVKPVQQNASELVLSNGSSVIVGTSMRSGTLQMLHVSEMGKISRRYPERAKEIVTGSLQAVHQGSFVFVESTAEGRDGQFYRIVTEAQKRAAMGRPLTPQEFRLHFFPWFADHRNTMDPEHVPIGAELREYFGRLRTDLGIELTEGQMAWYAIKLATLGDSMKAEHPSTPEEAFEAAVDGAIYGREMIRARQRGHIGKFPHVEGYPVNTFWDIGRKDATAIWFHQQIGVEHHFIDYFEDNLRPPSYYAGKLQERQMREGYVYGRHYLPHDAAIVTLASMSNKDGKSVEDQLNTAGVRPTDIVPQIADITIGINEVRKHIGLARFDQEKCETGIANLEQYQYEYDERTETFRSHPRHDWSSNGADAFRQWGQHFDYLGRAFTPKKAAPRSWKVA